MPLPACIVLPSSQSKVSPSLLRPSRPLAEPLPTTTGITESLAAEISHLGLRATAVEPGYFRTNFLGATTDGSPPSVVGPITDYHSITEPMQAGLNAYNGKHPGDAAKGSHFIIDAVLGEGWATGKELPVRLPLGPDAVATLEAKAKGNLKIVEEWREASSSTNHEDVA